MSTNQVPGSFTHMEDETLQARTPAQAVGTFFQDEARQQDPRQSATSVSSINSWHDSASSLERRSSNDAPKTPVRDRPEEVPEPIPVVARQNSFSTDRTLAEAPETDWLSALTANNGDQPRPGERVQVKPPRGIISRAAPTEDVEVIRKVEQSISYHFRHPDLLLEALESPDSGVVCVGERNRPVARGNKPLALYGQTFMETVFMKQFYLLNIPTGKQALYTHSTYEDYMNADFLTRIAEHSRMLKLVGTENLAAVGKETRIERWIRPRQGLPPSHQRNFMKLLKEDVTKVREKDPKRVIARAMQALVGAAALDGGQEAAEKVMAELNLHFRHSRA